MFLIRTSQGNFTSMTDIKKYMTEEHLENINITGAEYCLTKLPTVVGDYTYQEIIKFSEEEIKELG